MEDSMTDNSNNKERDPIKAYKTISNSNEVKGKKVLSNRLPEAIGKMDKSHSEHDLKSQKFASRSPSRLRAKRLRHSKAKDTMNNENVQKSGPAVRKSRSQLSPREEDSNSTDEEHVNEEIAAEGLDTGTDDEDYSIPEYSESSEEDEPLPKLKMEDKKLRKRAEKIVKEVKEGKPEIISKIIPSGSNKSIKEIILLRESKESSASSMDSNLLKRGSPSQNKVVGEDSHDLSMGKSTSVTNSEARHLVSQGKNSVTSKNAQGNVIISPVSSNQEDNTPTSSQSPAPYTRPLLDARDNNTSSRDSPTFKQPLFPPPYHYPCPLPPVWLSSFCHSFARPGWDSSPYKPSCNRPAWDENIYVEAKERFRRHEQVKQRITGFSQDYQLYPMAMANSPRTILRVPYDMDSSSRASPRFMHDTSGRLGISKNPSKISSPQMRRMQTSLTPPPPPPIKEDPLDDKTGTSKTTPDGMEASTFDIKRQLDTVAKVLERSARAEKSNSKPIASNIAPKIVPFRTQKRSYSPSWRKSAPEERKKAQATKSNTVKKAPSKPKQLNPLPRVALLSKAHFTRSTSGSGGFYSASMRPGIQILDDRGRVKPQWDPSPYIPIGKRSAWDETIPRVDYYRVKYIGWS